MFMYGNDTRTVANFETRAPTANDGMQALLSHLLETGALELREVEHEGKKLWTANVHFVLSIEDYHDSRDILLDRLVTIAQALRTINVFPAGDAMYIGATFLGPRATAQKNEIA